MSAEAMKMNESSEEDTGIREAYPLMDAVARLEGWDDPEMDGYNVYARPSTRG
jgi:hypothetical protein